MILFVFLTFALIGCQKDTHTITFESSGGTPVESMEVVEGDQLAMPITSREGYTLDGWYTSRRGGLTFDEKWSFASDIVQRELTLYAKWVPNLYQISFDGQGASSGDALTDINVAYDDPYGDLPVPKQTGHTFIGWYFDVEGNDALDQQTLMKTASNHTLYAIWQVNQYTISFDSNGGSVVASITADYDTIIIEPEDPTREGHTFIGWDPSVPETMPAEDVILTATWQINQYSISFNPNGGSIVESITEDYGTTITQPDDPTREGYTFMGWDQTIPETMTAESIELTAIWQINQYTISFDSKDGSLVLSVTQDFDTMVTEPEAPNRSGYTFAGWYHDDNFNERYVFDRMPGEDLTVYALWQNTIVFESNDGSFVEAITLLAGEEIAEPEAPTKEGHSFIAWFTDENLEDEFVFSVMPEPNIILYAKWQVNEYVVTFETNGGDPLDPVTLDYGTSLADHQTSREGFIFNGWHLEDILTTLVTTVPAMNVTVYVKWAQEIIDLVQVGLQGTTYTMPTGTNDDGTTTVSGGYLIATTETTYELWYQVRTWAEANRYRFQNQGREGHDGIIGAEPTVNKLEPVTSVSWRDVIVWLNAASEMSGFNPVYMTPSGTVIKDSRNTSAVDDAIQTDNNGYRLPTSYEWEMAARWRNSDGDGAIFLGGRYWTPGDYASGATADFRNSNATNEVAWYQDSTDYPDGTVKTQAVGEKTPNHLGLYDMSGNVREWTNTTSGLYRVIRDGNYYFEASNMQVGQGLNTGSTNLYSKDVGLRMVRTP